METLGSSSKMYSHQQRCHLWWIPSPTIHSWQHCKTTREANTLPRSLMHWQHPLASSDRGPHQPHLSKMELQSIGWSGKGVTSFHVFSFCCCWLNTVLNVLFFLVYTASVLLVLRLLVPTTLVYHSIFWASSEWNTSGHLGSQCLSCFDSLIKGISCDTL